MGTRPHLDQTEPRQSRVPAISPQRDAPPPHTTNLPRLPKTRPTPRRPATPCISAPYSPATATHAAHMSTCQLQCESVSSPITRSRPAQPYPAHTCPHLTPHTRACAGQDSTPDWTRARSLACTVLRQEATRRYPGVAPDASNAALHPAPHTVQRVWHTTPRADLSTYTHAIRVGLTRSWRGARSTCSRCHTAASSPRGREG